jgi:FkbM family methyltransferase
VLAAVADERLVARAAPPAGWEFMRNLASGVRTGLRILPSAISHSADIASFLTLLRIMSVYRVGNRLPGSRFGRSDRRAELTVRLHGVSFRVHVRWNNGDPYSLVEVLLGGEYSGYLPRGLKIHTIVDLGANIGMFSLLCAAVFPGADIYCVEPDAGNLDMLKRNSDGINTASVRYLRGAAWTYDGETTLITSDRDTEHSLVDAAEKTGKVTIPCYTMESIIRKAGFTGIDLLKVDIEGAERELLTYCEPWINRVKLILLELHPALTGFDVTNLQAKLEPLGFVVFDKRFPFCANTNVLTRDEMNYLTKLLA